MPRFRNYYNKRGKHNRIYSMDELYKMPMSDFIDKEDELDYQDSTIGLPFDDELKLSKNVRLIDGFTQDDGRVIPSRWESFAPVITDKPTDNTPSVTGGIAGSLPDIMPEVSNSEPLFKFEKKGELGTIKPFKDNTSELSEREDKLPDGAVDVLKQQPQEDTILSDDLPVQNKVDNLPQQTQNIQPNLPQNLSQPQEQQLKNIQSQQTEAPEQPQLSEQLRAYIDDLVNGSIENVQDLNIKKREDVPSNATLHGYITNTPDVIETKQVETQPQEYLDKKGKLHKVDEGGNEIKNDISIWDKLFNKVEEMNYNTDSWINKPSEEMNKRKTEIGLDVLTAPLGIGKTATIELAKKIVPFLGENIAQSVAEGIGGGLVSGVVSGVIHNIENKDNENPVATVLEDTISNAGKGAIGGYTKGQLNQVINPKNKNYMEFISELLKHIKR